MGIFSKKPRDNQYNDDYNDDFYRGTGDEEDVIGDDEDEDLIPPAEEFFPPACPQCKPASRCRPKQFSA